MWQADDQMPPTDYVVCYKPKPSAAWALNLAWTGYSSSSSYSFIVGWQTQPNKKKIYHNKRRLYTVSQKNMPPNIYLHLLLQNYKLLLLDIISVRLIILISQLFINN